MRSRRIGEWPGAARAWRVMLLLALVGMALSSLGGAIAAGQANPPPITQEEAADQPAIETAEPAATQPDTGEATAPATNPEAGPGGQQVNQPPVGRETGELPFFLELSKRVCPSKEGFIPESATFAELDDGCRLEVADPANFFFIVTDATGEQHVINGIGAFLELPTGRTRVHERHSGGYGDPVVFCSFGKGEPPQRMPVADRGVGLDPQPDMLITCVFFNPELPPVPDGDDGSITVVKVACPPGYDATSEKADPLVDCTKLLDDVGFGLRPHDPDVDPQKGRTGEDGRGTLIFEGLPAGGYTVEENLPEGFAEAVVWACTEDPREQRTVDGPLSSGTRLEVELADGQDLWCLWLNIAEGRPAEPTAAAGDDDGALTIYKWECPEGASNAQETSWYPVNCTTPMSGIVFDVVADSGTVSRVTDASGRAVWPEMPDGAISVREEIPDGYGDGVVSCYAGEVSPVIQQPVKEGAIQIDAEVTSLTCHWYNIPEPSGTGFIVDPDAPGTDIDMSTPPVLVLDPDVPGTSISLETPAPAPTEVATIEPTERPGGGTGTGDLIVIVTDAAGQPIGGACIALIDASGETFTESCDTAEWEQESFAGNGVTGFFGVPVGEYTVRLVSVPGGGAADDVAATVTDGGSAQVEMTIEDPAPESTIPMPWTPTLPDPEVLETPEATQAPEEAQGTDGSITVVKVTCPAGFDIDRGKPTRECTQLTDGVSFTIVGEGGESQRVRTGDDGRGRAVFAGLPAGSYEIVEAAQDGTEPVVWACAASLRDLASAGGPLAVGGSVTVELSAGDDLTCFWLNVPGGEEDVAAVLTPVVVVPAVPLPLDGDDFRISAFACDPGYAYDDYRSASLDGLRAMCGQPFAGLPMRVGGNGAEWRATDASGGLAFAELDAGAVEVRQEPRSGYQWPIVYCGDADGALQKVGALYFVRSVEIAADPTSTVCAWFVVPLTDDFHTSRIELSAFTCDADSLGPGGMPSSACVPGPVHTLSITGDGGWAYSFQNENGLARHHRAPTDEALTLSVVDQAGMDRDTAQVSCLVVDWADPARVVREIEWYEAADDGTVTVPAIGTNNKLRCAWYDIVTTPRGAMMLYGYDCPVAAFTDLPACAKATIWMFEVQIQEGDGWRMVSRRSVSYGGTWDLPHLRPGTYRLVPVSDAWCHVWTDRPADGGTFAIVAGEDTTVRAYRCTGG